MNSQKHWCVHYVLELKPEQVLNEYLIGLSQIPGWVGHIRVETGRAEMIGPSLAVIAEPISMP
jgi:hypothetical protein